MFLACPGIDLPNFPSFDMPAAAAGLFGVLLLVGMAVTVGLVVVAWRLNVRARRARGF